MSQIWIETQRSPPWIARVYARTTLAPIWVGAFLTLLYLAGLAIYFGIATALAGPDSALPLWKGPGSWSVLVNAVMIGFAPTVLVYTLRTVERDVRALAPALGGSAAELQERVREVVRLSPVALRGWGLVAAAATVGFTFLDPGLWSTRARPPLTDPSMLWFVTQQGLLGWLWSRAVVADVTTARAFSRLADRLAHVDLLDLRPLATFGRRGVRSVFYWMAGLALFSLFWLAPNAGQSNIVPFVLLLSLAGSNFAVLMLRAQRRIQREKIRQLERLRAAIRTDQEVLLARDGPKAADAAAAAARLPALFAAEARTLSVREWPFDAGSAVRFGLYLTIGIGSWVGGALVERLLGAAMD
jgi:hypothetical protein